ncbi:MULTISPECIES: rhamnogalacturonan acetylesterase [unclassified Microbulbifer]|uniref:rhamnogalacturonan acetylesterase n=1 Tax=unclassified Microbulbifer TaxID=2619833 RepID=UPI0027E50137|nr:MULTISPECIES: rhamnogalacturonan acetylesterase [unclassified Microbulbifer]
MNIVPALADSRPAVAQHTYEYNFEERPDLLQQKYNNETGLGTDNFRNSGENAFSVKVPEGDYEVRVKVTGLQDGTRYLIFSEDRRVMSNILEIGRGESQTLAFLVNVRNPQLATAEQDTAAGPRVGLRGDEDISRNWDDKLTIALSNNGVQFSQLRIEPVRKPKVLLAGDSTVADQASQDYASWGQFVPGLIRNRVVVNHARSGETLKSFLFSLRWDKLLSQTQAGDIVLIQFAHNDEKKQWPRTFAAADGAFPEYLRAFVADVRQKEAIPVLVTPVARRIYNERGELLNTHQGYDEAVREVARATGVPVIDLTAQTTSFYQRLGQKEAKRAFAADGKDRTHHNYYGAWMIANMVVNNLQALYPELIQSENTVLDSTNPTRPGELVITSDLWPDMRPAAVEISGS